MATPQLPATINERQGSMDEMKTSPKPSTPPQPDGASGGKNSVDYSGQGSMTSLPELNTTTDRSKQSTPKKSPLLAGDYEKQLLVKLGELHREGYTPELLKPKKVRNESHWKSMPGEPEGRHISQRNTVGANFVDPPMERTNKIDQK
jgi:hypothetical protein